MTEKCILFLFTDSSLCQISFECCNNWPCTKLAGRVLKTTTDSKSTIREKFTRLLCAFLFQISLSGTWKGKIRIMFMINNAFIISKKKQIIKFNTNVCMSHDVIVKVHTFTVLLSKNLNYTRTFPLTLSGFMRMNAFNMLSVCTWRKMSGVFNYILFFSRSVKFYRNTSN